MNNVTLPRQQAEEAMQCLVHRHGFPEELVRRTFQRWRRALPATQCRFGYKEAALASVDCKCEGCTMRMMMFFFDQVALKFGVRS